MLFNSISFICCWQNLRTTVFCNLFFPRICSCRKSTKHLAGQIMMHYVVAMFFYSINFWPIRVLKHSCLSNFFVAVFTSTFKLGRLNGISALFECTTISSQTNFVCDMHEKRALSKESCLLFASEKNGEKVTRIPKLVLPFSRPCHSSIWTINFCRMFGLNACQVWQFIHSMWKQKWIKLFACLGKQIRDYLLNGLVDNWKQLSTSSSSKSESFLILFVGIFTIQNVLIYRFSHCPDKGVFQRKYDDQYIWHTFNAGVCRK